MWSERLLYCSVLLGLLAVNGHHLHNENKPKDEKPEWILYPDEDGNLVYTHLKEQATPANLKLDPEKDMFFLLYTKINPLQPQLLKPYDDAALEASDFNPAHPTRFIAHGWRSQPAPTFEQFKDAYLVGEDMNIFLIDWSKGSNILDYNDARNNVQIAAPYLASFIDYLVHNTGMNTSNVHLVGHSLGAHVVGVAGRQVTSGKIHTVIGLDPAMPLFSLDDRDSRVNEDSADYVEIIHTCGGILGFYHPIGHADFYPNGGYSQPGCGYDLAGICSHQRSYELFYESVSSKDGFWAWNCETFEGLRAKSCKIVDQMMTMGRPPGNTSNSRRARGIYYLRTNDASPFAQGRLDATEIGEVH